MRTARTLLLIVALSMLGEQGASAKCAEATYTIVGAVVSDLDKPVAGASVLLFLDDSDEAVQPEGQVPITAGDGTFAVKTHYFTIRGYSRLFGHDCSGRLKTLDVVIVAADYRPVRKHLSVSRLIHQTGQLAFTVRLEPVILTKSAPDQ